MGALAVVAAAVRSPSAELVDSPCLSL
jgi:hypothetical protein